MTPSPRPVDVSCRIYRALLRAYPASFRDIYREEMTLMFGELAGDAWNRRGWPGLGGVWLRTLVDLASTLPVQYYLAWRTARQTEPSAAVTTTAFACISLVAAFALNLMLFAVLAIAVLLLSLRYDDVHYQHWPPTELFLTLVPPFLTGVIATRVKPFYRPYLVTPSGPVMLAAALSFADSRAPWITAIGYPLLVGATAWLGCYASDRLLRRRAPSCAA